jgi:polysaccharide export outer membrane protein
MKAFRFSLFALACALSTASAQTDAAKPAAASAVAAIKPATNAAGNTTTTTANTTTGTAADSNTGSSINATSYVLRPTDLLRIDLADDARGSKEVRIAVDGTIGLYLLDKPVKVAGLTINEATDKIKKAYVDGEFFIKPQVSLMVAAYAPRRINVNGQVGRPGWVEIPPEEQLTLVAVISAAGGPTRIANPAVTITRKKPDGSYESIHKNIKSAMRDAKYDFALQDGDSIFVDEDAIGF